MGVAVHVGRSGLSRKKEEIKKMIADIDKDGVRHDRLRGVSDGALL